jgi:hypothetical protein
MFLLRQERDVHGNAICGFGGSSFRSATRVRSITLLKELESKESCGFINIELLTEPSAAVPPDVRKGYAFPKGLSSSSWAAKPRRLFESTTQQDCLDKI